MPNNNDFTIESEILKAKMYELARSTGRSTKWHMLRALRRYLVVYSMFSRRERLISTRCLCRNTECDNTPGSDLCRECEHYVP